MTEAESPDPPEDRVLVKVGTPFCTLDMLQFGVVLKLWQSDDKVMALAIMESGRWTMVVPARLVAAGALMLRRFEVKL